MTSEPSDEESPRIEAPTSTPALPAPADSPKPETGKKRSGGGVWRAVVFLFRLALTLAILAAIVAGVYYGWPRVYARYISPVENNIAQVSALQTSQADMAGQLGTLQERQSAAETQAALAGGTLEAYGPRVDALENSVATHTASIAALNSLQANLEKQNTNLQSGLERQVRIMKSMELLSRARLFMYESNFGLAARDIQDARGILAALPPSAQPTDINNLDEIVTRLDLALSRLPQYPVPASDDLDIAWQMLIQGIPQIVGTEVALTAPASATPEAVTPTSTPQSATGTATPAPTSTATPTP